MARSRSPAKLLLWQVPSIEAKSSVERGANGSSVDRGTLTRATGFFHPSGSISSSYHLRKAPRGSGRRRVPEGFSRAEAWQQFKGRVAYAASLCERLGIRIALESLYRPQTTFINTIGECLDLADELRRDAVGVVADIDHIAREEPNLDEAMRRAGWRVIHVHLRHSNGRTPGYGGYDFHRFIRLLREIGYQGRTSIEARMDLDAELAGVRARLNDLWA